MLSNELREKLLDFSEKAISIEQVEEWLVPRMPDFLQSPYSADSDVIAAFELGLAELDSGTRTEEEFRSLVKEALQEHRYAWAFYSVGASQHTLSGSTSTTLITTPELLANPEAA